MIVPFLADYPLATDWGDTELITYLVPAMLPIAIPIGFTLGELQRRIRSDVRWNRGPESGDREFAVSYHVRIGLAFSTSAFTLFAFSTMRRRRAFQWLAGVAACIVFFGYYWLEPLFHHSFRQLPSDGSRTWPSSLPRRY